MTDVTIRGLERAAESSGSIADRAASLAARLRADPPCVECGGEGKTEQQQAASVGANGLGTRWFMGGCSECYGTGHGAFRVALVVAAYVGDEAARRALGEACACGASIADAAVLLGQAHGGPGGAPCLDLNLDAWLSGMVGWGHQVMVRAALAAASAALTPWSNDYCPVCRGRGGSPKSHRHTRDPGLEDARTCLQHVSRWCDDPSEEAANVPVALAHRACVPGFVSLAGFACTLDDPVLTPKGSEAARLSVQHAIKWASESAVRRAIADQVGSWALKRGRV